MDVLQAGPASKYNRDHITGGTPCGCYFCLASFDGGEVEAWGDEEQTALCPRCGMDAVVPGAPTREALIAAHNYWFRRPVD
jgi:hypothetical protein